MPKLELSGIRRLFAVSLLDEVLLRRMRHTLQNKSLPAIAEPYRYWMQTTFSFVDKYKRLPTPGEFAVTLRSDLQQAVFDVDPDAPFQAFDHDSVRRELEHALQFLDTHPELTSQDSQVANGVLDHLLEESIRIALRSRAEVDDIYNTVVDIRKDLITARSSGADRFKSVFGDSLDLRPAGRFIPTGNVLVDNYCNGTGPVSGDVIGHAAPRSGGKSVLANQIGVEVALREWNLAKLESRPPRWVYVFNYEKIEDPLTHMLSYLANIPRDTVEEFVYTKSLDSFSSGRDYKPYEQKAYAYKISLAEQGQGNFPATEQRRLELARKALQRNVMLVDFTPSTEVLADMADNYVDGITEFIESHQQMVGNPGVDAVIVDYASACVDRYLFSGKAKGGSKGDPDRQENRLIQRVAMQIKHSIAVKYGAFVWVAQQLAADEASRARGSRPDPNKTKGCRAFFENCDYGVVNGLTTEDGLAIAVHSKTRRGRLRPDRVIRLNGEFCNWRVDEGDYAIVANRIVSSDDVRQMQGSGRRLSIEED